LHGGERGADLAQLVAAQEVEQVAADAVDVHGCGLFEQRPPGVGEHREHDPPILGARLAEISGRVGKPEGTVGYLLFLARKSLKDELRDLE
jgi:hypothetical protein